MRIYVSDSDYIIEPLSKILKGKVQTEHIYSCSTGDYIVFIKAEFAIGINNKARWLYKFKDENNEEITSTLTYLSKEEIKDLQELIEKNKSAEIVNICQSNSIGQLNFEICMKYLKIDTQCCKRIWLRENNITQDTLNNVRSNNEYNLMAVSILAERILDAYWLYKQKDIFGDTEVNINIKEMLVLSLLNKREEEIREYEKKNSSRKNYLRINVVIDGLRFDLYNADKKDNKIVDVEETSNIVDYLKGKKVYITEVNRSENNPQHPLLYNTNDIYSDAQKLKIASIAELKDALENLYAKGFISNPATVSRHLPSSCITRLVDILSAISTIQEFSRYVVFIKSKGELEITERVINDKFVDKSHAVIPTINAPKPGDLNQTERALYNMIVKRFLSIFLGDKKIKSIKIHGVIDGKYRVKYEDSQVISYGWELIQNNNSEDGYMPESLLFEGESKEPKIDDIKLEVGNYYDIEDLKIPTGSLKGKSKYSLPTLMKALESCGRTTKSESRKVNRRHLGIGVAEERSLLVENMLEKGLIELDDDKIALTELGNSILRKAPNRLTEPKFLESVIMRIKSIEAGKETLKRVISEHISSLNQIINLKKIEPQIDYNEVRDYSEIVKLKLCPMCYNNFIEEKERIVCSKCKFEIKKMYYGYLLTEKDIMDLINNGITDLISGFVFKGGKITDGKGKLIINQYKKVQIFFPPRDETRT